MENWDMELISVVHPLQRVSPGVGRERNITNIASPMAMQRCKGCLPVYALGTRARDGTFQCLYCTTILKDTYVRRLSQTNWERLLVKTAAYQEVRDQLQQHNLVMLTGGPGEGKTTIGHMLCCDYQQQGYNTVFCSRWEDFIMGVFEATKPTLVVIDDMREHRRCSYLVNEIHTQINNNKLVRFLIIYTEFERDDFDDISPKMDITQIGRQNWDRTKQEYSQMLQMQTDIASDTREEIIANLPSYVGFPKVINHFCQDRPATDPVTFFAYPHSHFRKEIDRLLENNNDYSAAVIYILVSGNKVEDCYPYIYDSDESHYGLGEFESLFPELKPNNLPDMLHTLCTTYLCQSGDHISFTDPVIYDACEFVVDSMFPGLLWKHCKVLYETDNKQSLTDLADKTIFISSHNTDMFLTKLVEDTKRGEFRHTFCHPVLSREDNIDRFLTQLGDSFVDVLHLQDTAGPSTGSGSFLYWVLQSGNDYLCQKVLQKQELSQVHVSEELACCIRLQDTKSFLYLRQQLLGLQRGDITYTPNYTDADGNSLLMMSVDRNNADVVNMVDILLKDHAECLIKNKVGNSALHLACLRGYTNVVKLLLPHMEDWKNLPGQDLRTPVVMAALKGHKALFDLLVSKGCDLTVKYEGGANILHAACDGGNVEIVEYIVSHKTVGINRRGYDKITPVVMAALNGHKALFDLLVSKGCDLTVKYDGGANILHAACDGGNVEIVEYIVSHKTVDINSTDYRKRTPVMIAASKGHKAVFDLLVSKGCNLTVKDENSCNILHKACGGGNVEIVEYIVSHNIVHIKSRGDARRTPLMMADLNGHKAVVDLLVSKGCDPITCYRRRPTQPFVD